MMVVDEWHNNGPQDLITTSLCIQNAINKMHLCSLSIKNACPYHNPTAKFSETPLETAYGREINIKLMGNSSGGHSCSQHANCTHPQNLRHLCCVIKLHILEWPFIGSSLRHTCAIIMLYNQHLDMPHLWGGWIISAKEKCSLTDLDRFVNNIWEK